MEKQEESGICFFAYNNSQLDYVQFAHIAAGYVKANMKNNKTCLITDDGTYGWLRDSVDKRWHEACFDTVVIDNVDHESNQNPRRHFDSPWTEFSAPFLNSNKHDVFKLTPFKRTLMFDTDYIVKNNFYDYIFDTDIPLSLHRNAQYLEHQPPYMNEVTLANGGIHHWWSTVVYFDQSTESRVFFDTWAHVRDNWDYYALLYQFPKNLFRTDFCASIAIHLLNGYNNDNFVHDFLGIPMRNMDQKDDIIEIKSVNDWILLSHNRQEQWKNLLTRNTDLNLHAMNKRALSRNADTIQNSLQEVLYE